MFTANLMKNNTTSNTLVGVLHSYWKHLHCVVPEDGVKDIKTNKVVVIDAVSEAQVRDSTLCTAQTRQRRRQHQ